MTNPASSPATVTVVVLSYNSASFMEGCLDALARSRGVELEVVCIDNASRDNGHAIAEAHPVTARAIRTETNLGCAGGNNLGWRTGTAPYVVFINPDCRVMPDTLAELVRPLIEDSTVGAVGALLFYPNSRTVQHAGGIIHPNGMSEHIGMNEEDRPEFHEEYEVDFVTGALAAFRRTDLEAVGGFDEEFFPAYYEETDLLFRLKRRGKRILYTGRAVAYHWETAGLVKASPQFVRTAYRSRMRFIIKNYSLWQCLTLFLPFETKWFFGPFAKGFRLKVLRTYCSGVLFAGQCLLRLSRRQRRQNPH